MQQQLTGTLRLARILQNRCARKSILHRRRQTEAFGLTFSTKSSSSSSAPAWATHEGDRGPARQELAIRPSHAPPMHAYLPAHAPTPNKAGSSGHSPPSRLPASESTLCHLPPNRRPAPDCQPLRTFACPGVSGEKLRPTPRLSRALSEPPWLRAETAPFEGRIHRELTRSSRLWDAVGSGGRPTACVLVGRPCLRLRITVAIARAPFISAPSLVVIGQLMDVCLAVGAVIACSIVCLEIRLPLTVAAGMLFSES